MITDLVFSYLHFVLVFALVACLVVEIALVRDGLSSANLARVGRIDSLYGIAAILLLVVGFCRVYFGLKGADFYWTNPGFHLKLTLYVLLALASLPPTFRYISWRRGFKAGTRTAITAKDVSFVRLWLHLELVLLFLIPLAAGLMARGML
jgi:putative membrane protein